MYVYVWLYACRFCTCTYKNTIQYSETCNLPSCSVYNLWQLVWIFVCLSNCTRVIKCESLLITFVRIICNAHDFYSRKDFEIASQSARFFAFLSSASRTPSLQYYKTKPLTVSRPVLATHKRLQITESGIARLNSIVNTLLQEMSQFVVTV
jgi:hypothetical protein